MNIQDAEDEKMNATNNKFFCRMPILHEPCKNLNDHQVNLITIIGTEIIQKNTSYADNAGTDLLSCCSTVNISNSPDAKLYTAH